MNDSDRDINAHSDVRSLFASDLGWAPGRVPKTFTYGTLTLRYVNTFSAQGEVQSWTYIDQDNREFVVFND